jgi:hypothetical protein
MLLSRKQTIEIAIPNENASSVSVNGSLLSQCNSNLTENCWMPASRNSVIAILGNTSAKNMNVYSFNITPSQNIFSQYNFTCINTYTNSGESIYIVGNTPELGNWDTAKSLKLDKVENSIWTGYVYNISANTNNIQWKCIKKNETSNNVLQWQPRNNNYFNSISKGYGGNMQGSF